MQILTEHSNAANMERKCLKKANNLQEIFSHLLYAAAEITQL